MPTWKKILVEGDAIADNLATANLTQPSATTRSYSLNGDTNRLALKGGLVQFSNTSNTVSHQFDNVNGIFDARSANGIRLSDGDNAQYIDLKPKSEVSASYTITLPNAAPGSANRILEANATGDLSWIDTPSGGGGTNTNIAISNLTADNNRTLDMDGNSLVIDINAGDFTVSDSASSDTYIAAGFNELGLGNGGMTVKSIGVFRAEAGIEQDEAGLTLAGAHGDGADITFLGASSTAVTAGRIYYYNGTTWLAYTTATEAPQKALLGISSGSTMANGFILKGFVNPNGATGFTTASPIYGATNAGATTTAPTAGFQRVMGHSISTSVIYFNPSQDWIELA